MKKLIRWFNDFKKGYVRFRVCERCYKFTRENHWSKNDTNKKYGHIWLCFNCFYSRIGVK